MNRLSVVAVAVLGAAGGAWAEDACGVLLRQTQAFSDAAQAGDAGTMDRLLDPRVVFVVEDGSAQSKQEILAGARPPGADVRVHMRVMDWSCALHGGVAVARFTDDQAGAAYGQAVHAQFRSVETWLKQGTAWRMIGSQTVALQDDPAAVVLPGAVLDGYVGVYRAAPGLSVTIGRRGDGITASVNGGPAAVQKAEVRDVFFTPGHARVRKIFERDAGGAVTGFVSRHEGHDIVFRRV